MTDRNAPQRSHREVPRGDKGAAMVEMAIILPVLILLVFGLITVSRAYHAKLTLTHATREGVRVLAVTGDQDLAETATIGAAPSLALDPADVSVSDCDPGEPAEVSATIPFDFTIPFFGSHAITLSSTAVMQCSA